MKTITIIIMYVYVLLRCRLKYMRSYIHKESINHVKTTHTQSNNSYIDFVCQNSKTDAKACFRQYCGK